MKAREAAAAGDSKSQRDLEESRKRPIPLNLGRRDLRQVTGARTDTQPAANEPPRAELLCRAKEIFEARRLRLRIFGKAMFGEPAWDLLLAIYISEQQGGVQSVASLTRFSGAPPTTVFRWLDYLQTRGWIERDKDDSRRKVTVEITREAREALEAYLAETLLNV